MNSPFYLSFYEKRTKSWKEYWETIEVTKMSKHAENICKMLEEGENDGENIAIFDGRKGRWLHVSRCPGVSAWKAKQESNIGDTLHYVYRSSEDAPYRPIDPHRDTPHQLLIDAINNEVVRRRTDAEQIARQAKAMAREATLTASKARGSNNPHGLSLASPNISSLPNASQRAPVKPKSTQAGQVKVEKASETVPSSSRDPKVEEIARNVGDTSQPSPRGTFHAANSSKPGIQGSQTSLAAQDSLLSDADAADLLLYLHDSFAIIEAPVNDGQNQHADMVSVRPADIVPVKTATIASSGLPLPCSIAINSQHTGLCITSAAERKAQVKANLNTGLLQCKLEEEEREQPKPLALTISSQDVCTGFRRNPQQQCALGFRKRNNTTQDVKVEKTEQNVDRQVKIEGDGLPALEAVSIGPATSLQKVKRQAEDQESDNKSSKNPRLDHANDCADRPICYAAADVAQTVPYLPPIATFDHHIAPVASATPGPLSRLPASTPHHAQHMDIDPGGPPVQFADPSHAYPPEAPYYHPNATHQLQATAVPLQPISMPLPSMPLPAHYRPPAQPYQHQGYPPPPPEAHYDLYPPPQYTGYQPVLSQPKNWRQLPFLVELPKLPVENSLKTNASSFSRPSVKPRTILGVSRLQDVYQLSDKILGEGTFGVVRKAVVKKPPVGVDFSDEQIEVAAMVGHVRRTKGIKYRPPLMKEGDVVALKQIIYMPDETVGMPITTLREVRLLKLLDHPSIVKVLDIAYEEGNAQNFERSSISMVFPYMEHDLAGLMNNPKVTLSLALVKRYSTQLLEGTAFMHKNNIVHRDIKAANLLIDNNGSLKIADFGLARSVLPSDHEREYTGLVMTRWYRAPELLLGYKLYGFPIDMWGIGCVIGEMLKGRLLFQGDSDIHQAELIFALCGQPTEWSMPKQHRLPGCDGRIDWPQSTRKVKEFFDEGDPKKESGNFMEEILLLNPEKRLTAKAALDHEWFWTDPLPMKDEDIPKFESSHENDRRQAQEQEYARQRAHQRSLQQSQRSSARMDRKATYCTPSFPSQRLTHQGQNAISQLA